MVSDPLALVQPQQWVAGPPLTAEECVAAFDGVAPLTIGIEVELMLVDAGTLELTPAAGRVLARVADDPAFKTELRPSQLELVTPVCSSVPEAIAEHCRARERLQAELEGDLAVLAAGTHPFSTNWGEVSEGERYRQIADEYTWAAVRSTACGLHVHVAVGGADRSRAVYNSLRSFLPELGALAANSPFAEGVDTGLASIRAKLNEAFPRSGTPPALASWSELTDYLGWARRGGLFPDATYLWWELRPHPTYGTIELRVADAQTRIEDTGAVAALFHALVAWLAERYDDGERLPVHSIARIAENQWRSLRYGVRGWLVDLDTGDPQPTRDRLRDLLDVLDPVADRIGCGAQLADARTLLAGNGAERQRYVAERDGVRPMTAWLLEETRSSAERMRGANAP